MKFKRWVSIKANKLIKPLNTKLADKLLNYDTEIKADEKKILSVKGKLKNAILTCGSYLGMGIFAKHNKTKN